MSNPRRKLYLLWMLLVPAAGVAFVFWPDSIWPLPPFPESGDFTKSSPATAREVDAKAKTGELCDAVGKGGPSLPPRPFEVEVRETKPPGGSSPVWKGEYVLDGRATPIGEPHSGVLGHFASAPSLQEPVRAFRFSNVVVVVSSEMACGGSWIEGHTHDGKQLYVTRDNHHSHAEAVALPDTARVAVICAGYRGSSGTEENRGVIRILDSATGKPRGDIFVPRSPSVKWVGASETEDALYIRFGSGHWRRYSLKDAAQRN